MKWEKLGLVFDMPKGGLGPKGVSHCANPRAINLDGDIYRVFYCARDKYNRSSVFAVDIDIGTISVSKVYKKPFLTYGSQDVFFSDGISIGNFYEVNGIWYLTFMGWKTPRDDHWYGQIGLARVTNDFNLVIDDNEPMVPLDKSDPISLSYPWVTKLPDGTYEMWYGSTKSWEAKTNKEMVHTLKRRCSSDGFNWAQVSDEVPFKEGVAQAFSSPCIYNFGDYQRMWFSYRSGSGESYRIGSAISYDRLKWELTLSDVILLPSEKKDDWDSEMIEYPYVFEHKGQAYMLYNGNGYGKTGFGLAVLKRD